AVIGMGSVAMDIVRLVVRDEQDFIGSDVNDAARTRLVSDVAVAHVIGRSGPENAKFAPVMSREIVSREGVEHVGHGVDFGSIVSGKDARFDAVSDLVESSAARTQARARIRVRVEWWFEQIPVRVHESAGGAVEAVTIERTEMGLRAGADV